MITTQGEISNAKNALEEMKNIKYNDIGSALEGLGRTVQISLVDSLEGKLLPLIQNVIAFIVDNQSNISNVFTNIGGAVSTFIQGVSVHKDTLINIFNSIKEIVVTVVGEIMAFINAHSTEINTIITGISNAVQTLVNFMLANGDIIIGLLAGIGAGLLVFKGYESILIVVEGLKALKTATEAQTIAQALLNAVMSANPIVLICIGIAALVAAIIVLWKRCEGFREVCKAVWKAVSTATMTAVNAVGNGIKAMINWFKELPSNVSNFLTNTRNKIVEFGKNVLAKAKEIGKGFVNGIVSFVKNLPKNIGTIIGTVIGTIIKFYATMISWAIKIGTFFVKNIINFLKKLPSNIASIVKSVISHITSFCKEMGSKATQAGKTFFTNLINGIKNLPKSIANIVTNIISKITNFVKNMGNKAKQGAKNFKTNLINGLKALPKSMLSIGKNVVEGLWNGIKNSGSWIKEQIGSFCSGIVKGFKGALGIHSPSRVMRDQVGVFVSEGVAEGIKKGKKKVINESKGICKIIVKNTKPNKKDTSKTGEQIAESVFEGVRTACKKNKKKDLGKELFDTANVKMDYLKKTNKITLKEELSFWKEILSHCTKGTKEYNKVLDKITAVKKSAEEKINQITKTYTDRATNELEKYKKRHDVSTAEEISYWNKIKEITKKGTDEYKEVTNKISELNEQLYQERKEILKNLETADKDYNSKVIARQKELTESLNQLQKEYRESIKSISESIQSALGLFDKFESSTDKTSKDLIDNMKSQVTASEQYYETMEKLRSRGISKSLLEDLQKAGIKDLETLKVISNMTDKELQQFQSLYNKRNAFATKEATNEVDKDEFEAKTNELRKKAEADLKSYETELKTQTKTLEKQLRATYNSVDKELQSKANTMVRNFKNAIKKYCNTSTVKEGLGYMGTTTVKETNKKGMECKSAGRNLVDKMADGLKSGKGHLANVAASVVSFAIEAMKQAGDIHSPSRKTKDLIGKNLALGVSEGFKENVKNVKDTMSKGLSDSINMLAEMPVNSLQDVVDTSFRFDPASIQKNLNESIKSLNFNAPEVSSKSSFEFKSNFNLTEVVNKLAELGNKIDKVGTALNDKQVTLDGRVIGKFVDGRLSKSIR